MRDAGCHFGDVLGPTTQAPRGDGAGQGHFTLPHLDLDVGGINERIVGEPLADVLADTLVGSPIALRA